MTLLGKLLLILTSLAPTAVGLAINEKTKGDGYSDAFFVCVATGAVLCLVAYGLVKIVATKVQKTQITLSQATRNPKDTLAFLVAYLYPVTSSSAILTTINWYAILYITVIVVTVLLQNRSFHINPVVALLGYQVFDCKDADGYSLVMFVKGSPPDLKKPIKVARVSADVVFYTEDRQLA